MGKETARSPRTARCFKSCRSPGRRTARSCSWPTKTTRLWYVDIDDEEAGSDRPGQVRRDYRTTPGRRTASGWPTTKDAENRLSVVYLYSLDRPEDHAGHHRIPTVSIRSSIPTESISTSSPTATTTRCSAYIDFEFANPKATRVYVVTLRADLPSPFAPHERRSPERRRPEHADAAERRRRRPKAKERPRRKGRGKRPQGFPH